MNAPAARTRRCANPLGCRNVITEGVLCPVCSTPRGRRPMVRATSVPVAAPATVEAAGASLAAEGDTHDDTLPPPWRCDPRVVAIHRASLALRIASMAQAVAVAARRASTGGDLDGLNDSYDDLEAAMREGMPWMRAARGER
jgi:hypothetical protein